MLQMVVIAIAGLLVLSLVPIGLLHFQILNAAAPRDRAEMRMALKNASYDRVIALLPDDKKDLVRPYALFRRIGYALVIGLVIVMVAVIMTGSGS